MSDLTKPAPAEPEKVPVPTPMPPADPDDPDADEKPETGDEPTDPGKAAAAAAPDPSKLAEAVMRQRDAKQLAALVREKKVYEAGQAELKEARPRLSVLAEFERLFDDDPAAALEYMIAHKAGDPERARAVLATAYDGLTSRILGAESKAPADAKVERSVSRIDKRLQSLEEENARLKAEADAAKAADAEQRIQGAIQHAATYLGSEDAMKAYPYLLAEADDPAEVVWGLMVEADRNGVELTLGAAAEQMNAYFQPTALKKKDRYSKLLLEPTKGTDTPSKPETSKSQNGTSRKSLTNADASKPPVKPAAMPVPRNESERREQSWLKLREGHKR